MLNWIECENYTHEKRLHCCMVKQHMERCKLGSRALVLHKRKRQPKGRKQSFHRTNGRINRNFTFCS